MGKSKQHMVRFPVDREEEIRKAAERKGLSIPLFIRTTILEVVAAEN